MERIRNAGRPVRVLNLFAYTGGATLAARAAGAEVTHVDSVRQVVTIPVMQMSRPWRISISRTAGWPRSISRAATAASMIACWR